MLTKGNITGSLDIVRQGAIGLDNLETQNTVYVTLNTLINGTYTLLPAFVGRVIGLYGGAINAGYEAENIPRVIRWTRSKCTNECDDIPLMIMQFTYGKLSHTNSTATTEISGAQVDGIDLLLICKNFGNKC